MRGGALPAPGARGGQARSAPPPHARDILPDWAELLDRLDRLERERAKTKTKTKTINEKGEG
jgi:hypothetical protein